MGTAIARREAGWRWMSVLMPGEHRNRIKQLASTYHLSMQEIFLHAINLAIYQSPPGYWQRCSQAGKVRTASEVLKSRRLRRQATSPDPVSVPSIPSQSPACESTKQASPQPQDVVIQEIGE